MWNNIVDFFTKKIASYKKYESLPVQDRNFFIPAGTRIYAIGDVHGCYDALAQKIILLGQDIKDHADKKNILVMLGDYIDRGLGTKKVIDLLLKNIPDGCEAVFLKGNHEIYMLEFFKNPASVPQWLEYGGLETLRSYGVIIPARPFDENKLRQMRDELVNNIPQEHHHFFNHLKVSFESGDYFFVHAGVNPDNLFYEQTEKDLTSIRKSFIEYKGYFDKKIIHGHTPSEEPEILHNRINLDTGAYLTGNLTMMVFEDDTYRLI